MKLLLAFATVFFIIAFMMAIPSKAHALDLSVDQINIGFVGDRETAEDKNYKITSTTQQLGLELYVKTTIYKTKTNFSCAVGRGKESKKIKQRALTAAFNQTLEGNYMNCQVYIGLFEWKR